MSVQMQQFRVVGVDQGTGKDVSVIIDAATKAAAEVKAEKMNIETTHIVRMKQDGPAPVREEELFSTEAAEALVGKPTHMLIEEVVPPEEARLLPDPAPPAPPLAVPAASAKQTPDSIVQAITRPNYTAPASQHKPAGNELSGGRTFSVVLLLLLAMSAGAYFVLVHEPNAVEADEHKLIFGKDLYRDVTGTDPMTNRTVPVRDAFGNPPGKAADPGTVAPSNPPINPDEQIDLNQPTKAKTKQPAKPTARTSKPARLELQSIVTSKGGRYAVINGKLYKQGSQVAGHKLVNVADDWVLMEKDGKQFTLEIEQQKAE